MDMFEWLLVAAISLIFVSFSYAVIETAENTREMIEERIEEREQKESRHLPTECRHLYDNDTSEEWMDCMGVGYK